MKCTLHIPWQYDPIRCATFCACGAVVVSDEEVHFWGGWLRAWRARRVLSVLLLLVSLPAYAQPVPRQIVGPGGCGAQADALHAQYQTHTVFLSSEGTAWEQPPQEVWITAFNPLSVSQWVVLVLTADGNPVAIQPGLTLGPRSRWAWHANQLFRDVGFLGNVNFSTILTFELHGAAAIATWSNNYQTVFYGTLIQSCEVPLFRNPYQQE